MGEPIWLPYNRPADDMEARRDYLQKLDKGFVAPTNESWCCLVPSAILIKILQHEGYVVVPEIKQLFVKKLFSSFDPTFFSPFQKDKLINYVAA